MPAKQHSVRVTLTREHRDAIYGEIESVVDVTSSDLNGYFRDAEFDPDDRRAFTDIVWRLAVSSRLLEQLGWDTHGSRDTYDLEVDDDLARFMEQLDRHMRVALEDDGEPLLPAAEWTRRYERYGVTLTEEQWDREVEARRRVIDLDLDGIDAARIVREACRKAVS